MKRSFTIMKVAAIIGCILLVSSMMGCNQVNSAPMSIEDNFTNPRVAALVRAAVNGNISEVKNYIAEGVSVNSPGSHGVTPLMFVLMSRNKQGARALLELGADPNQPFDDGYTAVWFWSGADDPEILELLLTHGGNPNVWAEDKNALMFAVRQSRWENFDLLLKHGADINGASYVHSTAAIYAAHMDAFDKVVMMLERGYNYRLIDLARSLSLTPVAPDTENYRWREKALRMLEARGVPFPLPPPAAIIPEPMDPKFRAELEALEKSGSLQPGSRGQKLLDQERERDKQQGR
ncbi:Hypothetical protein HDN1F_30090 [gamma proteobacterium HdN1]|nr:Hypothetical protein HDN1F_30090 [gamma proteobacterium HdN1]